MSDATDRLRTFLTISPSVVFPDEALELFESVETEVTRLSDENAKLRELAHKQDALTKAVYAYWAGGERSLDDFNVMMDANAQVLTLMRELRIEVE